MRTFFAVFLGIVLAFVAILTTVRVVEYIRCTNRCASDYAGCMEEANKWARGLVIFGARPGGRTLFTANCESQDRWCNSACKQNALRSPF
jgi:hypothetical protein